MGEAGTAGDFHVHADGSSASGTGNGNERGRGITRHAPSPSYAESQFDTIIRRQRELACFPLALLLDHSTDHCFLPN